MDDAIDLCTGHGSRSTTPVIASYVRPRRSWLTRWAVLRACASVSACVRARAASRSRTSLPAPPPCRRWRTRACACPSRAAGGARPAQGTAGRRAREGLRDCRAALPAHARSRTHTHLQMCRSRRRLVFREYVKAVPVFGGALHPQRFPPRAGAHVGHLCVLLQRRVHLPVHARHVFRRRVHAHRPGPEVAAAAPTTVSGRARARACADRHPQ